MVATAEEGKTMLTTRTREFASIYFENFKSCKITRKVCIN